MIGRMKRAGAAVWRPLRRWPKSTFTVLTLFVLLVVPVQPFFPSCVTENYRYKQIFSYMSDEYRYMLKLFFRDFGVYYWDIGGIVFVRVLPFLDGEPDMDQYHGILNAQNRAAFALSNPNFVLSPVGHEIGGRIYRIPDFIRELVAVHRTAISPHRKCHVMPYIVTLKPPPAR